MSISARSARQNVLSFVGIGVWVAVGFVALNQTAVYPALKLPPFSIGFSVLVAFAIINIMLMVLQQFETLSMVCAITALVCGVGYETVDYLGITVSPDYFYMEWVAQLGTLALIMVAYAEYARRQ